MNDGDNEAVPEQAGEIVQGVATKDDAIEVLTGIRSTFLYGMCIDSKTDVDLMSLNMISQNQFGFERADGNVGSFDLTELRTMLADQNGRRVVQGNYRLFLRHALVHRTHEVVLMYCDRTGQFKKYEAAPWYQFARIYRNVLAHHDGSTLSRWIEPKHQQATWRHRNLTPADVGSQLHLDPWETLQLHVDICVFLMRELQ